VLPGFEHDPEHDAWKEGVMSGDIRLEEIGTAAFTDRYGKPALRMTPQSVRAAG
jgi:hypothetical protein